MQKSKNMFALQKVLLKFVGISLDETQGFLYKAYSATVLVLMATLPLVQIRTFIIYMGHVEDLADILMYFLFNITVLIKVGVVLRNRKQLRNLLDKFESGVFRATVGRGAEVEELWIKNCTKSANKLVCVCTTGLITIILALPALTFKESVAAEDCHDWQFTFGPILNVTCTPYIYPAFLYQTITMGYYGFVYTFIFLTFISVLMHLRNHFKIAQNAIGGMLENARSLQNDPSHGESSPQVPWRYLKQILKNTVRYHEAVLDLSQKFKELFSPILLALLVSDLFLLGWTMQLTLECSEPEKGMNCTRGILCYLVLIVVLFVVSYWGNEIDSESRAVARVAAEVDFVGLDPKFQNALSFIILRSQKPCTFTAGGFVGLSLQTLAQVLRGSYSYFMLLYKAKSQ